MAYLGNHKFLCLCGILIASVEIMLGATRTVAFTAVTVSCLIPLLRSRDPIWTAVLAVVAAIVLLGVISYANEINAWLGRDAGSLEGLDGRSDIWATYLNDFLRAGSTVFGLGFLTGGRYLASQYPDNPFGNLHNMYLEALVDTGVVGLVAYTACLLALLLTVRCLYRQQASMADSMNRRLECRDLAFCWLSLVSLMVSGFTSNALIDDNSVAFMIPIAYLLITALRARRAAYLQPELLQPELGLAHIGARQHSTRGASTASVRF